MKDRAASQARGPIDLLEESCHLLRRVPVAALAAYYIGAVPFLLGLLYFTSDMSRSAFAAGRIGVASLGLALLYLWMRSWQVVYADRLMACLANRRRTPWTPARIARMAATQAFLQPLGFLVLPMALLVLVPFGWSFAFFANITVLGNGGDGLLRHDIRRAWRQCLLWPRQNHVLLLAYKLFFLFVLLNLAVTLAGLPWLLKLFLGVESAFTLSPWSMFNTSFFMCLLGLAYLCLDPLIKASYVLRCFYGESLQSGLDLQVDLAPFRAATSRAALLFLLTLPMLPLQAATETPSRPVPTPTVAASDPLDAQELDQTIRDVIRQREYSWRLPREGGLAEDQDESSDSALARFLKGIGRGLESGLKWIGRGLRDLTNWLRFGRSTTPPGGHPGYDFVSPLRLLLILLIVGLAVLLGVLFYRAWKSRQPSPLDGDSSPLQFARLDVADETVGADQLPDDEWMQLARELLARGDLRLSMRAFYLASLAHLASRNLIALAKFKSNLEYERELHRRAHALPDLTPLFHENVSAFDRVWYGLHDVTPETVSAFAENVDKIRRRDTSGSGPRPTMEAGAR